MYHKFSFAVNTFFPFPHTVPVKNFTEDLQKNVDHIKKILPEEDVYVFFFETAGKTRCAVVYTDGIVNKDLLGDQVIRPLSRYRGEVDSEKIRLSLLSSELKEADGMEDAAKKILDGDVLLLIDGSTNPIVVGLKMIPTRAVAEPPTDVTIKGPRLGFIEDIKTNVSLVRSRIKTTDLKISFLSAGKQSLTKIAIVYVDGIGSKELADKIKRKIEEAQIDNVADSSYVSKILSEKSYSLFKSTGTTEKPDIFCAHILEGRIGVIVDGSPIALTLPYVLIQDFQSSEDYFVNPYRATATRLIRFFSLFVAIYLPALYVAAQLFKIQLIPMSLIFRISASVQGIPLSPSLEMALVLFVLEVLNEASIRMPKYVGYALSIVGALVLGDTAVSAGIVSTTAIIIIAFSGICLYTVPNLYETTSIIRWIMLFIAGSIGTYGIVLFTAYLLYYMVTEDSYGVPLLAPFAPLVKSDLKDSLLRIKLFSMKNRPKIFRPKNKTRIKKDE